MGAAALQQLMFALIVLSIFLLIGTFLRAILPPLQKTFLPASVIGGFLALLAGPIVWQGGGLPFNPYWLVTWGALPGVLIVPVVASVPLGLKLGGKTKDKKSSASVIKMFSIMGLAYVLLVLIGLATQAIFNNTHDLYPTLGYELAKGFTGGHGTAGVLGNLLYNLDLGFWETAQGVTVATATFGLIIGMVLGIIYLNIMARRGQTKVLDKPTAIPADMLRGLQLDKAKQKAAGKETTYSNSIESLTFHTAIILLACGLAFLLMNFVQNNDVPVIREVPVWTYAIAVMFGINFIINKLKLDVLVDGKTKGQVTGILTDFAIIAAIASMPVRTVLTYIAPLMFMVVIGTVIMLAFFHFVTKKMFGEDYSVERMLPMWGISTGVFITGVMLLKIVDPEFESPVLNDVSISFSFISMSVFIGMPFIVSAMLNLSLLATTLIMIGVGVVLTAMMLVAHKKQ